MSKIWRFLGFLCFVGLIVLVVSGIHLDRTIQARMEGKIWNLPAKVYARPMQLHAQAGLNKPMVISELKRLNYQSEYAVSRPGTYSDRGASLNIHVRAFDFGDAREPARGLKLHFKDGGLDQVTTWQDRPVGLARLDPMLIGGIYPDEREDRVLVSLDQAPEHFIEMLLAVEDRAFFRHHGVSLKSIARALAANIKGGRISQGGSTLTQQLIKNLYLTNERSLTRKATEAYMALLMELRYDKRTILQTYLNEVYLGQSGRRAIHGFGLAAQHYFGRSFESLDLHQSALLVGMVKGPSFYSPTRQAERAKTRRDLVLNILLKGGLISTKVAKQQQMRSLSVIRAPKMVDNAYPAFLDLVKRQLNKAYSQEDLKTEGLRIFTTLDPLLQSKAEQAVKNRVGQFEKWNAKNRGLQAAMLVTQPDTAEVLAMVSDANPRYSGFNRVIDAKRPIGSLVKPAVYLSALRMPEYNLGSPLIDGSIKHRLPNGTLWEPENFDRESHGQILLQEGLVYSYNQATAKLGLDIGLRRVVNTLKKLGAEDIPVVPSLLLGSIEMTPYEVMGMYQVIAANGFKTPIRAILRVLDGHGLALSRYPMQVQQAFDGPAMTELQYAMQQTMWSGTGRSAYRVLPRSLGLAGKTGTSNDQRDSWFAGFSGNYLGVVWLGHDKNTPTTLTGSTGALSVWSGFMSQVSPQAYRPLQQPGFTEVWVDRATGGLSARDCDGAVQVLLSQADAPMKNSPCLGRQDAKTWLQRWFD